MKSELKTRTLQSLADAYSSHELRVRPEYQRGTVWKLPQKQGLIDSLLRGYQIPLFYVHLEAIPEEAQATYKPRLQVQIEGRAA